MEPLLDPLKKDLSRIDDIKVIHASSKVAEYGI